MTKYVVCPVDELPVGTRRKVNVGGRQLVIFSVDGRFYALRDRCPHQGAALSAGTVVGRIEAKRPGVYEYDPARKLIKCPWHGWEFDLATGQSFFDPARQRVGRYEVTVESPRLSDGPVAGPYVVETADVSVERDCIVVHVAS
jgi:nitrite reductase/ring-hydroxylating ferredoxin subunit